jgi:hypothetical protein
VMVMTIVMTIVMMSMTGRCCSTSREQRTGIRKIGQTADNRQSK